MAKRKPAKPAVVAQQSNVSKENPSKCDLHPKIPMASTPDLEANGASSARSDQEIDRSANAEAAPPRTDPDPEGHESQDLVEIEVTQSIPPSSDKPKQVSSRSWSSVVNGEGMQLEKLSSPANLKLTFEDFASEVVYWENSVICRILGGNPPLKVFDGFIRRIWKDCDVLKVSSLAKGAFIVKLSSPLQVVQCLSKSFLYFDGKPVLLTEWTPSFDVRAPVSATIPVWVRLHNLDMKYWNTRCLSLFAAQIGIPIKSDNNTVEKNFFSYARVQVEIKINDPIKEVIAFEDECGAIKKIQVEYEWKPIKCDSCGYFGHEKKECKKNSIPQSRPINNRGGANPKPRAFAPKNKDPKVNPQSGGADKPVEIADVIPIDKPVEIAVANPIEVGTLAQRATNQPTPSLKGKEPSSAPECSNKFQVLENMDFIDQGPDNDQICVPVARPKRVVTPPNHYSP